MSTRRRRGGSILALLATGIFAVAIVSVVGTVMAILGSEIACMGGGGSAFAAPATRAAVRDIPPRRLRVFQAAGRRIDIDWRFLAAIGEQECGEGNCAGVNSSGCAGPMQIGYVRGSACSPGSGPTIWELYRVDGDGDGATDVNNPADAIFTAARILRKEKGAAGRRLLCRLPGSGLRLLRRLRRWCCELRRRGDGPRRLLRVRRQRIAAPVEPGGG
jgi:hypothetical protein